MAINIKRLGLAVLFVLITIGLGVLIYFVFFRNAPRISNENGNVNRGLLPTVNGNRNVNARVTNVNGLPNINALVGEPQQIADGGLTLAQPVADTLPGGATTASNGRDLLYYDSKTGQFLQVSPDGRSRSLLTPDTYPGAEKVTWSPIHDKAILEFPDGSKYVYDFRKKKQYTLAPEMNDIAFSPNADSISFKFFGDAPEDQLLVVSNFDGTGARTLEPLADKASQFAVNWSPAGNVVATFQEGIDADRQRVIPIGQLGENFASFNAPGRGFQGAWSPTGSQILFSVFRKDTGYNPTLYVAGGTTDNFGGNMTDLGVQTWPDKCTFGVGSALYCAVPQYLEQGTGLFPNIAKDIPDDFYRIDLTTGQKQLIARPVNSDGDAVYTARKPFLSSDQSILYFFDERTQQIQKIQLR